MSRVTFNSLFALETAYVRSEEDDEFLRGEFPLRFSTRHWRHSFNVARVRFHRSVQALYHTWPRTAFNGPSPRMATHRHGKYIRNTFNTFWRKIDTPNRANKAKERREGERGSHDSSYCQLSVIVISFIEFTKNSIYIEAMVEETQDKEN